MTMTSHLYYLVVAYPIFSSTTDYEWIQHYRSRHDTHHTLIQPHFTIIFPIPAHDISQSEFIQQVKQQLDTYKTMQQYHHKHHQHQHKQHSSSSVIDVHINVATLNFDSISKTHYHEFLVPDQGYSQLVKLHDTLYNLPLLITHRRYDLPYIPHITIGQCSIQAHDNVLNAKKRIDRLNFGKHHSSDEDHDRDDACHGNDSRTGLCITGTINTLDIVQYNTTNGHVTTLETLSLL